LDWLASETSQSRTEYLMKIISDFRDYYDSVKYLNHFSNDPSETIFIRKTVEKEFSISDQSHKDIYKSIPYFNFDLVGIIPLFFCGKFYMIPTIGGHQFQNFSDALEYRIDKRTTKESHIKDSINNIKQFNRNSQDIEKVFRKALGITDEFFIEHQSPYFIIKFRTYGREKVTTIFNPRLEDLNFMKILDPFQTYQEIELFFNSVLININDKDAPQITDSAVICEAKGFDKKMSFRKRKEMA